MQIQYKESSKFTFSMKISKWYTLSTKLHGNSISADLWCIFLMSIAVDVKTSVPLALVLQCEGTQCSCWILIVWLTGTGRSVNTVQSFVSLPFWPYARVIIWELCRCDAEFWWKMALYKVNLKRKSSVTVLQIVASNGVRICFCALMLNSSMRHPLFYFVAEFVYATFLSNLGICSVVSHPIVQQNTCICNACFSTEKLWKKARHI